MICPIEEPRIVPRIARPLVSCAALARAAAPPRLIAQHDVVRTADPIKRGMKETDFPIPEGRATANFREYAQWTLAKSQGPIAIRKVYEELDGNLK